jgi:hypothetical protein
MNAQTWQQTFDFPGERDEDLRRVGGEIGAIVFAWCRRNVGREFHATELWEHVSGLKTVAPDSPRRILSLLAKHGFVTYVVVDRSQSLYRVTEVKA